MVGGSAGQDVRGRKDPGKWKIGYGLQRRLDDGEYEGGRT